MSALSHYEWKTEIAGQQITADVVYDFTPEQPQVFDCPGSPAQVDIMHVWVPVARKTVGHTSIDITDILDKESLDALAESILAGEDFEPDYDELDAA